MKVDTLCSVNNLIDLLSINKSYTGKIVLVINEIVLLEFKFFIGTA